ncbi:MAG: helix-turn-helix transcriptional regulator [Gammaproteobacteria bacterium]|nr:helix-turn-helix transcriptional regulator [Gammaproteobacteria bacterium]
MAAVIGEAAGHFLSVKQVAAYLQLNEKKIYALVNEGGIPATKVTGKWMFPRELIDRWMMDSAHGGLLTDRLVIAGSDDPLVYRVVTAFARDVDAHAQVSYTPTGTRLGLELLQANRVDVSALHWGPLGESHTRHPALLRQHPQHRNWVLIRAFSREQGLMLKPSLADRVRDLETVMKQDLRWVQRQSGAGAQRFLMEVRKSVVGVKAPNVTTTALSEREAAAAIVLDLADVAPGARAAATEAGLAFVPFGVEGFDFVLPRSIWFRRLFQELLTRLRSGECRQTADLLGGYDFSECGDLIWGQE